MVRKLFLSFLGTNNYVNCNYVDETDIQKKVENVKYVQEAILRLYCKDFNENDIAYIFVTKDAKNQNWEDNGQFNKTTKQYDLPNIGLKGQLQNLVEFKGSYEAISIPEGFSSNEISSFNFSKSAIQDGNVSSIFKVRSNCEITEIFGLTVILNIRFDNSGFFSSHIFPSF